MTRFGVPIGAAVLLASSASVAQTYTPKLDADPFVVSSDPRAVSQAESADPIDHWFALGLALRLSDDPLVACVPQANGTCAQGAIVSSRFASDLGGAIGFGRFGLHAQLPIVLDQNSDYSASPGMDSLSAAALGDLRIGGKVLLARSNGFSLGVDATLSLPTGGGHDLASNEGLIATGQLLLGYRVGRLSLEANGGYAWHQDGERLGDLYVDDEVVWSGAAEVAIVPAKFSLGATVFGRVGVIKDPMTGAMPSSEERPAEALGTGRYWVTPEVAIEAGAGGGISTGYSAPEFRMFAGVRYFHERVEQVLPPPPPPEPPPPPPVTDCDGDGIPDDVDKCPDEPEDKDNFQDADGCPDPDNDGDGILDTIDKCPNEPETVNGFQDEDGCPDQLPPQVKVFTGKIDGIAFATGSAKLLASSFPVLDKAAAVLAEFPALKLEIQGHTDDQKYLAKGDFKDNTALSQARADAVKAYLASKGVAEDRMVANGYGETVPLVDVAGLKGKALEAARAKNRRVEFAIRKSAP